MKWRVAIWGFACLLAACGDLEGFADNLDQTADVITEENRTQTQAARETVAAELSTGAPVSLAVAPAALEILDGDTVRFEGQRYRLRNANTPETDEPKCAAEAEAGARATAFVRARVDAAESVELRGFSDHWVLDRYRRRVAYLLIDGADLGDALIAAGLASRRGPGAWCADAPT